MPRLNRVIPAMLLAASGAAIPAVPAAAQNARVAPRLEQQEARAVRGSITGTVSDEGGDPLRGAMVSALGVAIATSVTDDRGHFALDALPAGEYVVRAHMSGFAASARQMVRVGVSPSVYRFQLRKLDVVSSAPVAARPIMAAGFELPLGTQPDPSKAAEGTDHPHSETAWRLRHIKRSILKNTSNSVVLAGADAPVPAPSLVSRVPGSVVSSIFTDLPLSGEVNLLTTGAAGPGNMFSEVGVPRGVAYLALGVATGGGDWAIRAAMSEGDLSSWIVAGAFASRGSGAHSYNFGLSYSTQEYQGGTRAALTTAVTDGSRNVGELYGGDRWFVTERIALEYGGRYAHYDYLEQRGLFSPRVGVIVEPLKGTRVRAAVAQRMLAPGAEEFLSPQAAGPWLPPERTFAALGGPGDTDVFRIERARSFEIGLEREFGETYVLGLRRFYQSVDDQLVTLFGLNMPSGPQSVGHYYVASAGAVDAAGWAFRVSTPPSRPLRGSIDYSVTRARWISRGDMAALAPWVPAAIRSESEDLHDVTTSLETEIEETATRVFVVYKINTGYTRSDTMRARPGLDARFDLQVNQALPLAIAGTKWEVLFGVRNLFRDPSDPASVYDELLVLRPPKRLVGGVLVKF
jgi:hypothetical protein